MNDLRGTLFPVTVTSGREKSRLARNEPGAALAMMMNARLRSKRRRGLTTLSGLDCAPPVFLELFDFQRHEQRPIRQ